MAVVARSADDGIAAAERMAVLGVDAIDRPQRIARRDSVAAPAVSRASESIASESAVSFAIVRSIADFDALEREWNELFACAGTGSHLFQTFNWCWHWTRHYMVGRTGGPELAIVAGRLDGRLVFIWPLVVERFAGLRQLVWMGGPPSQYGDVLIDPQIDAATTFVAAHRAIIIAVRADLMRLRLVRADAAIAPYLTSAGARITETYEAPSLDFSGAASFKDYEQRYSAKSRKNRRRLMRRLEERAPVRFDVLTAGAEAGAYAAEAVRMKRCWLKSRNLVSKALASDRMIRFLSAVATAAERPVGCEVSVLHAGDVPASIQIGFRCRERLLLHVIVFDLEYEKAGVGVLHLEHAVARVADSGVRVLDLLSPRSDYKMDWADATTPVADYALPLTLAGRLFIETYLVRLRPRLKRLAPRLPARLRQLASNS